MERLTVPSIKLEMPEPISSSLISKELAAVAPGLKRIPWSRRRYQFVANGGPLITNTLHVGKGVGRKAVKVAAPSHLLKMMDITKYDGVRLRAIRKTKINFKGEIRR